MRRFFASFQALPGMSAAIPFMAAAVLLFPLIGIGVALITEMLASGNFRALIAAAFSGALALARVGSVLAASAGFLYARDLGGLLRAGRRTKPDLTFHHWWAVWGLTVALSVMAVAWALDVVPQPAPRVSAASGLLLLLGWVTLTIMGQLYKVTPFLMWYYRYARGLSAFDVPRLDAPYYPRAGILPFYLTLAGSTFLAVGTLVPLAPWPDLGASCFCPGRWPSVIDGSVLDRGDYPEPVAGLGLGCPPDKKSGARSIVRIPAFP